MIGARCSTACEHLAARVLAAADSLAPESAEIVARRVFDTLGALAAGAPVAGPWWEVDADDGAFSERGLLSTVRGLCAAARASEVDDIECRSCTTPGSVAVPAALALAAGREVTGPRLLGAVAAGYEAMVAIGEAIDGPLILYRGIWPSYLAAPLAAAASAATLLELEESAFLDALSIAAARSAGIAGRPPREPTSRWFLYGCAAADGVAAALAAERGVAGDVKVLEAILGAQTQDEFREITPLAGRLAVDRVDVKPFCTARQAQPAVEAARLAWADAGGGALGRGASIEVGVPQAYRDMVDQPHPDDRVSTIMSAQFQIAAAFEEPDRLYDVTRAQPRLGAAGTALMDAITVVSDPELTRLFPGEWPGRATLRLGDGREITRRVLAPDGAGSPAPGWDWLERKHAALGGLGADPAPLAGACRGLPRAATAPARSLLDKTLSRQTLRHTAVHNGGI